MCGHMQHCPEDIKRRLLCCIDEDRHVTDMAACLSVIGALESMSITKKVLEDTRLGLHVNEIRRKTSDQELSRRLKQLVKKWRETCLADKINGISQNGPGYSGVGKNGRQSISPSPSVTSMAYSRGEHSPYSLPSSGNASPRVVGIPQSSVGIKSRNVSPAISSRGKVYSDRSNSPHLQSSNKPTASKVINSIQNAAKVSRTIAANKRMRKVADCQDLPPSKRSKTSVANGFEDDCSRDSIYSTLSYDRTSKASNDGTASIVVVESQPTPLRRSGRRRKSQNDPQLTSTSGLDSLKQKMAVIGTRPSKVKTTSQIVADLAKKKGDKQLARRASILGKVKEQGSYLKDDHVTKNKMEHMQRFLKSQREAVIDEITLVDDDDIQVLSPQSSTSSIQFIEIKAGKSEPLQQNQMSPRSNMDLLGIKDTDTTEEILARLPPIDFDKLRIADDDEMSNSSSSSSSDDDSSDSVARLTRKAHLVDKNKIKALHSENIECQNGNYDMNGRFKEWHEVVLRKSYQDAPFVLLPYVIIDY